MRLRIWLALGAFLLSASYSARAAEPTPSLDAQLRAWLSGLTGQDISALPLRITPDGDHYRLDLPVPGLATPDGPVHLTGTLRAIDGRWSVEDIAFPPSARFAMRLPDPADAKRAVPADAVLTIAGQQGRMLIDPTAATPSTFEAHLRGLALDIEGAGQYQRQRIERYDTQGALNPAEEGRLDLVQQARVEGWRIEAQPPSGAAVVVQARRAEIGGRLEGLNRERFAPLVAAIAGVITVPRDDDVAIRAALHRLVEALRDSIRAGHIQETFDSVQIAAAGQRLGIGTLRIGLGADAPESRLASAIDLELAGLELPSLPPELGPFMPRRLALRPATHGIDLDGLTRIALVATAPRQEKLAPPPDIASLFTGPGISLTFEPLTIEWPAARLEGAGGLLLHGPDRYTVQAHLIATGFDAMTDQVSRQPALRGALPFLILLRGLARPDGESLVWEIGGDQSGITVNGVDLSGLAPNQTRPDTRR